MKIKNLKIVLLVESMAIALLLLVMSSAPAYAAGCADKKCKGDECSTAGGNCDTQSGRYCTCAEVGCITYECAEE
jgi:hypothetical protein